MGIEWYVVCQEQNESFVSNSASDYSKKWT